MAPGSFPILFITATRIGDAVLSSGLVKRLADEIPNARFTIVAGPAAAPLFAQVPNLDEVIVFAKAKDGSHWFDLWRKVRRRRWGLIVDLRGSAISRFLSTKRRAVYRKPTEPMHKVLEAARTLRIEDSPAAPYIYTSPDIEAYADDLTAGSGPILAVAPAANWVGKTWPVERFSRVAMRLLGPDGPMRGGRLMVLGGPEDQKLAPGLKDVVPRSRFIDLAGKVDLVTAFACLKRARLFMGNDSGTMHLAAAAGIPTLGLFGPSDERHYAPWGEAARVVRGPRSFEQIHAVDPGFSQALCHMMDLSVDTVAQAAAALFTDTEPSRLNEGAHG
ncbi:glycosyltransferase family 9 protein [Phenylobacterium hankyongense]|uniref:Glycosyltransferase family 9 protein n=1 Tax=Phenylobacterium hankyongense TaxID=1813876 RepID=A0A328AYR9_9CAUL|nr:glycosyltransferase family 9 protein [Phenylobacterium hankyongense]RAK60073.1 glycosyltransferase family 9 protein [Phenylobacterium hankyongense]